MFIDYLTLLLVNMVAGLIVLAAFVYRGLDEADPRGWAAGFAMSGVVAVIGGFYMCFVWPLPGPYNAAFGETSVLFGIIFLGAALALAFGWSLLSVTIYAVPAGLCAALLGVRILSLGLTAAPLLTFVGFLLTGAGGVFALPVYLMKGNRALRLAGTAVLVAAAAIWMVTAGMAYWDHLARWAEWKPLIMK